MERSRRTTRARAREDVARRTDVAGRADGAGTEEIEDLRRRLAEAEELVRAIRAGEVDALFIADDCGDRVVPLEEPDSVYRALVEAMNEGAALLTEPDVVLYCNARLATMLARPLEKVMGSSLRRHVLADDRAAFDDLVTKAWSANCGGTLRLRREDGTPVPARLSWSPLQIHGRTALCLVATDLTERILVEQQLRSMSLVDDLTGLSNRRGFLTLARQQLKLARRLRGTLLLLFADVDGLKIVNDRLGHREGDRLLRDAALVLRATFRESDIIARFGGDEFAVLATGTPGIESGRIIERLQAHTAEHNLSCHRPYELSLSIGIVNCDPGETHSIDELLLRADEAMYQQKRQKRAGRDLH